MTPTSDSGPDIRQWTGHEREWAGRQTMDRTSDSGPDVRQPRTRHQTMDQASGNGLDVR